MQSVRTMSVEIPQMRRRRKRIAHCALAPNRNCVAEREHSAISVS
jgi:hypothetical protein